MRDPTKGYSLNTLAYANALRLAEEIRSYWAHRGKDVKMRVERMDYQTVSKDGRARNDPYFVVRSNIVYTFPR
jgi:hypothetical protein